MPQRSEVLVAMADSDGRSALASTLAAKGLEPILVPNLRTALDVLNHKPVAMVFCEHELEDGGFHDILGENAKHVPSVPVVVCSPSYDHDLYMDAMTEGAFDFIAFPYAPREIDWILSCAMPRAVAAGAA